jgi:hypothetical protein
MNAGSLVSESGPQTTRPTCSNDNFNININLLFGAIEMTPTHIIRDIVEVVTPIHRGEYVQTTESRGMRM